MIMNTVGALKETNGKLGINKTDTAELIIQFKVLENV